MIYFDMVECMRSKLYWTPCLHTLINDYMANILILRVLYEWYILFTNLAKPTTPLFSDWFSYPTIEMEPNFAFLTLRWQKLSTFETFEYVWDRSSVRLRLIFCLLFITPRRYLILTSPQKSLLSLISSLSIERLLC